MNAKLCEKYLLPTAMGVFYTISSNKKKPARQFLRQLMSESESIAIDSLSLNNYLSNAAGQVEILYQIQKNGWIHGLEEKKKIDAASIEVSFPGLLEKLSKDKKALLADDQGFCIVSTGFDDEDSELIAALSAGLSENSLLSNNDVMDKLNIQSSAFALVDVSGHSNIGFWPIYIGDIFFILVISGVPDFDQEAFVDLIWSLHQQYCVY